MHFGLEQIGDLPGLDELKGAGLFDGRLPKGFGVPQPSDDAALREDEEPLEDDAAEAELEMDVPEEPEEPEAGEESASRTLADEPVSERLEGRGPERIGGLAPSPANFTRSSG